MGEHINTSVLVIDDEEMVRDNIEEILTPNHHTYDTRRIDAAANVLFDTVEPVLTNDTSNIPNFIVHKASNGMDGLEMVKQSLVDNKPYAVIFLDMRMPGWDGLETAVQIRKYDLKAEIIFVTAFSDRSINEILANAGQNVGYHCKPYASEEIIQLATKAVTDYGKLRNLEKLIEMISSVSLNEHQLNPLLQNILDQLALYIDTDMALLGKIHDDLTYEKIFSIGPIEEKINIEQLIAKLKNIEIAVQEVIQIDEVVLAKLDNYSIFAVLKKDQKLKTEKIYLLKLFVQNAAKAIRNAELNEKLLQKEKLSAIGKAVSMMMHDLRSPIMNLKAVTDIMREEKLQSEWIDVIDMCGSQAAEIFEDFMDFINDTPIKKYPVPIKEIVDDGIKMAEGRCSLEHVTMNINIAEHIMVSCDKSKLKRVVMNMVNNAVDALQDNRTDDPAIDITAEVSPLSDFITLQIRDNGPGIPEDIQKTLFDAFITKDKSNGTGLGLTIVKQYVTAHGGSINTHNDKGAVFTITLPLKIS